MVRISFLCLFLGSCASMYATSTTGTPCPSTPTTLTYYERNFVRTGCSVGIVDYTNFQFLSPSSSGVPTPTADQVYLTPVALGFAFTYGVTVPSGSSNFSNFTVQYDFDPAPALGDGTLELDPPQGDVVVTEQVCPGGTFTNGDCLIATTDPNPIILVVYNPGQFQDTQPLNVSNGEINLNFSLSGDSGAASFDSVNVLLLPGTSTPEPATGTLLAIGTLVLMAGIRITTRRN